MWKLRRHSTRKRFRSLVRRQLRELFRSIFR